MGTAGAHARRTQSEEPAHRLIIESCGGTRVGSAQRVAMISRVCTGRGAPVTGCRSGPRSAIPPPRGSRREPPFTLRHDVVTPGTLVPGLAVGAVFGLAIRWFAS